MLIIEMKNIEILENLKSFEKQKCRSINFFFTNNPNFVTNNPTISLKL